MQELVCDCILGCFPKGDEFRPLSGVQVHPATQQHPSLPLHPLSPSPTLAKELRPPHLIDGRVGMLQNLELVVNQAAAKRPLLQTEPAGFPHVQAGGLDPLPLFLAQLRMKEPTHV